MTTPEVREQRYSPNLLGKTGTTRYGERVIVSGPAMDPARAQVHLLTEDGPIPGSTFSPRLYDIRFDNN